MGYGRYGNPTWHALEEAIGALEGGRALAFGSGMAAAHAVLELLPPGFCLVLPDELLPRGGGRRRRAGRALRRARSAGSTWPTPTRSWQPPTGADLVWLETPDQPDDRGRRPAGRLRPVWTACRWWSTTPSPPRCCSGRSSRRCRPGGALRHEASVRALRRPARRGGRRRGRHRTVRRPVRHPEAARRDPGHHGGLPGAARTADASGAAGPGAAERRRSWPNDWPSTPRCSRVRYPGLPDDPGHAVAARTMAGSGRWCRSIWPTPTPPMRSSPPRSCGCHATSLGGVESTLERRRRWPTELPSVPEGLVRLSVGIEHVEDLWTDLEQALARLSADTA